MCGINGVLAFDGGSFSATEGYVSHMRDVLAHRGPDGASTWVAGDGRIGLGHRRLSIIDLSETAAQPMANEDGSLRIVFNGEIYNHAEIRRELTASGRHQWKTDHSDTEVILHAFEEWGIDCLARFRGMFAFGLWDARARQLWLVRDRIGIKPLYFSVHHGRLTFASEIKALLDDPDQRRDVDDAALFHFLSFLTTPGPQTLFAGIQKLPPATWLRVDADGGLTERRYWDVWDELQPAGSSENEIAERVLEELRTAVRLRKVSDVPVGVFLSGGLDSSTNAALFSEGESRPVQTFSIGYAGDYASYPSELPYARQMAQRVGADHHEYLITAQDVIDFLPEMVRLQDEPIADPVCVPVHYVAKLARQHGTIVCQVGEGADELFIGYPNWIQALQRQRYDDLPMPAFAKGAACAALAAMGYDRTVHAEWLRRGARREPLFWSGAEAFTDAEKRRLLSPRLRRLLAGVTSYDAIRPIRERFEQRAPEPTAVNWMSYVDLHLRLPELLLMRVDKMTMSVGLEARVPFLDHRMVGLAMSIPGALKTKNGTLKYILKKAVRGLVPDDLITRRKQGFGVPVNELFEGPLAAIADAELRRFCADTDLLDRAEVARVMSTADAAKRWYLLNLAMWWRTFIAGESAPASRQASAIA
ncbi:MAG: asparagine synthase (glutamine-hydrolyzing) [Acidobacteria bacterium]|nr:asparagine synthase (glutamine-hydrolyzing) [Acidobacteriota bacterium]